MARYPPKQYLAKIEKQGEIFTTCSNINYGKLVYSIQEIDWKRSGEMTNPKKSQYFYLMLSLFGAISLSLILFFLLYRIRGIGDAIQNLTDILAPFVYGSVVAYLLRPLCNLYERFWWTVCPNG